EDSVRDRRHRRAGKRHSDAVAGMVLIALGAIFLGQQLHPDAKWTLERLWPVLLIVIGVTQIAVRGVDGIRRAIFPIFIGALFLLDRYRVLRIHQTWPLFIVLVGLLILFSRRDRSEEHDLPQDISGEPRT